MTNVSFSINSFKLLALPDSIRDFFEITYTPSGQMSAGLATDITVKFIPKVNEDIISELPVLTATGPMNIPVECTTKKVSTSCV